MRQAFWFGSHASTEYKMILTNRPAVPSPLERGEAVQIPGVNGEVWIGEGVYDPISFAVAAWIPCETEQAARRWLVGQGALRFGSATAPYWDARITGVNFVPRNLSFGYDVTITFTASPFRHVASEPVTITASGQLIENFEYVYSEPIMTIEGNGEARLTIGEQVLMIHSFPDSGRMVIDTAMQECYWDSTPCNALIEGALPVLMPGDNAVAWEGGITKITIDRRLRRI